MVFFVIAMGFFYALPNLYGEDPALQISGTHGVELDQKTVDSIKNTLQSKNIEGKYEFANSQLLIRFANTDEQLSARQIVSSSLSENYVVALNLAPATPEWMRNIGMHPLKLGLDLRGGVHFLMEVDMEEAMKKMRAQLTNDFRTELRNHDIRLSSVKAEYDYVLVEFKDAMETTEIIPVFPVIVGVVASAVVGIFAIKLLQVIINKNLFKYFGIYCTALGFIVCIIGAVEVFVK